jgi:hypothetical protein
MVMPPQKSGQQQNKFLKIGFKTQKSQKVLNGVSPMHGKTPFKTF